MRAEEETGVTTIQTEHVKDMFDIMIDARGHPLHRVLINLDQAEPGPVEIALAASVTACRLSS